MKVFAQLCISVFSLASPFFISQNISIKGHSQYTFHQSKIYLVNAFHDRYYEKGKLLDSASVDQKGNFQFNVSGLKEGSPYKLIDKDIKGYSETPVFFISSRNVSVDLFKMDSLRVNDSRQLRSEKKDFDHFFKPVRDRYQDLYQDGNKAVAEYGGMEKIPREYFTSYYKIQNEIMADEKKMLSDYVKEYSGSGIAFWKFVEMFQKNQLSVQEAGSILSFFSPLIKKTFAAREIAAEIHRKKIFAMGQTFPLPYVTDLEKKKVNFKTGPDQKYTLIEFWFSHCLPCRRDLPDYIRLYQTFAPKGFTIINIATDRTKDLPYLRKTIKDFNIPWVQYLDENGDQAKEWGINSFPSSFLLNDKNEIIGINLSVSELNHFLLKNTTKNE
ncbi:TlpA disulfide reductase family protein [Chryseobacterium sp.]|uniref:TlpA family protein disulfide reductase n=1 Tax=Chryseobacterium sp. TaxID=1871047 RepID=UPI0025BCB011|nr:TlpA disulfide reductase family protein [Chryseobacterium sp.]MBV8327111.1 TlpA family protein disulfide reductase [Chryseobacterium sp.]